MNAQQTGWLGSVVLCGGASRRMGQSKAWLPWGERTLLEHVVEVFQKATSRVVVVAAPGQELPPLPPDVTLRFDPVEYQGPLQGMHVGLAELRETSQAAFVSSCDTPFIHPDFVRQMGLRLQDHEIAVPQDDQHLHPLAAVYRTTLVDRIEGLLQQQRLRPRFLIDGSDTIVVDEVELRQFDPTLASLQNVNTPREYERAVARWASREDVNS